MSAHVIRQALRKRFSAPAWAFLEEVPNATGHQKSRTADGVAISLWASRGFEIHGFEIKVSRGDWRRELKDPTKSAPIQRFCHRWWIVAPSVEIAAVDELPPTWGLLILQGNRGLVAKVPAPKLDAEPPDIGFVCALGRSMHKCVDRAHHVARAELSNDADYQRGLADGKAQAASAHHANQLAALRKTVSAFEDASGLQIRDWTAGQVGEAVAIVVQERRNLVRAGHQLRHLRVSLDAAIASVSEHEGLLASALEKASP